MQQLIQALLSNDWLTTKPHLFLWSSSRGVLCKIEQYNTVAYDCLLQLGLTSSAQSKVSTVKTVCNWSRAQIHISWFSKVCSMTFHDKYLPKCKHKRLQANTQRCISVSVHYSAMFTLYNFSSVFTRIKLTDGSRGYFYFKIWHWSLALCMTWQPNGTDQLKLY